ncbi:MAG: hypothetical protein CK529_13700 [Rhodospirillaceae bacterium]|nr:MAG: hypothetical protein CK529_13700 [Rhodospirillaceae bacterium]
MSETNQLSDFLRAVGGLGGRRQSLQSRLAEQMMAGLQNQTPIYSTGAAVARAGEGLLAGLMAKSATDAETKREDELYQRGVDRQDQLRLLETQDAEAFQKRLFPGAFPPAANNSYAPISAPEIATDDNFFNTLGRQESGDISDARNPLSSATGKYQFIDDTWRDFARANPASFSGMDNAAILAARVDDKLSRKAAEWYAGQNSQNLAGQNLPNGYPELALAHRFGPGGAAAILRAAPDALVVDAIPNGGSVLAANPTLKDVSVRDFLARNNALYGAASTNPSGPQSKEVQTLLSGYRAASGGAPTAAPAVAPAGSPFTNQANPDLMKSYIAAASSQNPRIRAMAPGILAQVNRQDNLAARVNPTVEIDGPQGAGTYERRPDQTLVFIGPRLPPQESAETFTGAPQTVMQNGKLVLVQIGNRGTVRPMEGFEPRNDGPYQGTSVEAQDINVLLRGDPASPEYAAAFARQAAPRVNVDGSTITPNMRAYRTPTFNPNPAAATSIPPPVVASPPPAAPPNYAVPGITEATKPSADQSRVSTYAARMAAANLIIDRVGGATTGVRDRLISQIPGVGNYLTSSNFQQATQAQSDFINAVLRRESGAVISDSEFASAAKQYFPQPGDNPAVLEQKRKNRETTLLGFEREAGPAVQPRPVTTPPGDNMIIYGSDGKRVAQ